MSKVDISPARAVDQLARYEPDIQSLDYEGRTWTVAEIADTSAKLATVLSDLGVRRGDRVAYLGFNSPTFLLLHLACARLGGIFVPVTLDRLRVDPAVSSAVFVTTITDVTGFFSFLGLASLVGLGR